MPLYVLVVFFSLYLIFISSYRYGHLTLCSIFLCSVLLGVLIGSRDINVGNDTYNYYSMIETMINKGYFGFFDINVRLKFEWFYWFEIYILTFVTQDVKLIMTINTIGSIFLCLSAVNKLSKNGCASVAFFIVTFTFFSLYGNVIRQGAAVSFFLWCYFFSKENRFFLAVTCAVLSMLCHASGAFSLVPLFFYALNISGKYIVFGGIFLSVLFAGISSFLSDFAVFEALNFYMDTSPVTNNSDSIFSGALFLSISVVIYCFYCSTFRQIPIDQNMLSLYFFFLLISLGVSFKGDAAYRISLMRFIFEPLLLAETISNKVIWCFLSIILSFGYFFVMANYSSFSDLLLH